MPIVIDHANLSSGFNINELTSGTLDGNGVFDILMKSVSEHLGREFANNRMRGTDYANAYVQAMNNALNQACGYALQKTKQPLEIQLMEAQLQKMAVDTGLVIKQGALIDAQASHELAQTSRINYEIAYILPIQLHLAKLDIELKREQVKIAEQEFELKKKQVDLAQKELDLKERQIELAIIEVGIKKQELILREKEVALKDSQLALMAKEIDLKAQQIALMQYEMQYKLPAEVRNTNAQASLYEQKTITERGQTNAGVIGENSVMALNNNVLKEQALHFTNDSKIKVMSALIDTWKVRFTEDPNNNAVTSTAGITDPNIGRAVTSALEGARIK